MRRLRTWLAALAALVLGGIGPGVSTPVLAATAYVPTALPQGAYHDAMAFKVAMDGSILGSVGDLSTYQLSAAVWHPDGLGGYAGPITMPPPSPFTTSAITDVNDSGVLAGQLLIVGVTYWHAAVWTPDGSGGYALTDLDPDGYSSGTVAINKFGTIIGYVGQTAAVWQPVGGGYVRTDLPLGSGSRSSVRSINVKGVIVGTVDDSPAVWLPGSGGYQDPILLPWPSQAFMAWATYIDDVGDILGTGLGSFGGSGFGSWVWKTDKSGQYQPIVIGPYNISALTKTGDAIGYVTTPQSTFPYRITYTPYKFRLTKTGTYTAIALPVTVDYPYAFPTAVSDTGTIVGQADALTLPAGTYYAPHPMAWRTRGGDVYSVIDLGTLGGTTGRASALNTTGDIVGTSTRADGTSAATLWRVG